MGAGSASSTAVAFDLVPNQALDSKVALFGHITKGGAQKQTRPEIWSNLRQFLDDAILYNKNPGAFNKGDARKTVARSRHLAAMKPILEGRTPWVIDVHRSADIRNLINMKKEYPKLKLVVSGGAEAWTVAPLLKESDIPVMITPSLQTPLNCHGAPACVAPQVYCHSQFVYLILFDEVVYG